MRAAVVLGALAAGASLARADAPITNRDYAIDLYTGAAIGDTRLVGMGGAGAALILGTAGTLVNPSALAVRDATDHDRWSFDYHLDALSGALSTDYDNNGRTSSSTSGAQYATIGFGGRHGLWAMGATFSVQSTPVSGSDLVAGAYEVRFVVARMIPQWDLALGVSIGNAVFTLDENGARLFDIYGWGIGAGATWLPAGQDVRVGVGLDSPIDGGQVQTSNCDPDNCDGHILPDRVRAPLRVVAGGAYRFGPTPWNEPVAAHWRDERAVTVALDLVLSGPTANGYGLEAFGMDELQRSGRHTNLSVRGGAEFEALPGRLRVRAGSYWEPGRFDDVGGRLHGTAGLDVRVFEANVWGPRRGRISATVDAAARYLNFAVSVGFWH